MTISTLAVNSNNDIYVGNDGNLAIVYNLEATLQACAQAAKTQLGEMVLATDQGIPNFQTVWVGTPNLPQFEAAVRYALLNVPGVTGIQSFITSMQGTSLLYTAIIVTIYGTGNING
jgi:hypothetical protein